MAEPIAATNAETIRTSNKKVWCDGPEFSKHPRIYLTTEDNLQHTVVCPYCSRTFIHDPKAPPLKR